jgi:hypothetical protein
MRLIDWVAYQLGFNRGEELALVSLIACVWVLTNLNRLIAFFQGKPLKTKRVNTTSRR